MLIDSHCHINSLADEQQKAVCSLDPVRYCFIDSGINIDSSIKSLDISRSSSFIYSSLGFHPFCVKEFTADTVKKYEKLIEANPKVVAIGEAGLDYKAGEPSGRQEDVFREFIDLAKRKDLPLAIHNRFDPAKGHKRVFSILNDFFSDYHAVVFHCFSYSKEMLLEIVDKGGFISFSLNILRKNKRLLEALKACPLDNLLLETDSPYMKVKDRLSLPVDIEKVYSFVAEIKQIDQSELEKKVSLNIKKAFPLIGCL